RRSSAVRTRRSRSSLRPASGAQANVGRPAPPRLYRPPADGSSALEQRGLSLADADAHRRDAVAPTATAELVQQSDDEPRAAHAERMPDRDRAAVDVHTVRV